MFKVRSFEKEYVNLIHTTLPFVTKVNKTIMTLIKNQKKKTNPLMKIVFQRI